MITQSMTKLEGNPMTGLFDRSTDQGARSIQPKFRPVRPEKVVYLKRWTSFFEKFPGCTEPIHWVLDRTFRKFWLNGSHPRSSHVFSQCLRLFWCIHGWGKQTRVMDTALSKRDRSQMWYRYVVDFWHSISVFANISYGIAVLDTLQRPPLSKDIQACFSSRNIPQRWNQVHLPLFVVISSGHITPQMI